MHRDERGVSTVIGVALLFGVVLTGMFVVVVVGGTALDETRGGLDTERAEKTMTQLDSRSAMVALGTTSHQGVDLAVGEGASYGVDSTAGWMNVTIYNETADDHTELTNVTLGAVVYAAANSDERVAYQGGGVWQRTGAGVRMLSPPEFHFRDQTLTLPIITVSGSPTLGRSATVTRAEATRVRYPNATEDENFTNPLAQGHVNVTVRSEYYEAWGRYFAQRTDGNVTYDHDNRTARAQLVVPFDEGFDDAIATTTSGGITMNGNDDPPDKSETGVFYPLADDRIDDRIEECESDPGACDDVPTGDPATIDTAGTYYTDSDFNRDLDIQDPGEDVVVVVHGKFKPTAVTIDSDYNTTILVKNSDTNGVVFGSDVPLNDGGPAGNFSVVVHSDVDRVKGDGNYKFVGLLYAPGSDCQLNGGGSNSPNVVGGAVCDTADLNGNPNDFEYDASIENTDLGLDGKITPITFLHVTENPVNVTSG